MFPPVISSLARRSKSTVPSSGVSSGIKSCSVCCVCVFRYALCHCLHADVGVCVCVCVCVIGYTINTIVSVVSRIHACSVA